jgi:DNA-binding SARP family transcriptional activator
MRSGKSAGVRVLIARAKARCLGGRRPRRAAGAMGNASASAPALLLLGVWLPNDRRRDGTKKKVSREAIRATLDEAIEHLEVELGHAETSTAEDVDNTGVRMPDIEVVSTVQGNSSIAGTAVVESAAGSDQLAAPPEGALSTAERDAGPPSAGPIPTQRLVVTDPLPVPPGMVRLLGRYALEGPGQKTVVGRPRDAWLLLGLLLEFRRAPLQRQTVIDKIWPDEDPSACPSRFWTTMKEIRSKLCRALDRPTDHGKYMVQNLGTSSYRLNAGLFHADVWELRDALASAGGLPAEDRPAVLETAVELYTGPLLPGVEHEWAQNTARALDRAVVQALVQLADLQTDPERAVHWLERATGIDPAGEHLFRRRMQAYVALGRFQAVHHCYAELGEQLRVVGDRPEQRTTQLYRRLIAQAD